MGFGEWLGLVLFVVGIPIAWLMGRRNMQRPTMRYAIHERELIRADDALTRGGLSLQFRGRSVPRLCRTYLAIWVRKGAAISASAIPTTDPLGLEFPEGDRILSARIVAESRDKIAAKVAVSDDRRQVTTSFEFLDANDGFVVEVLHERHVVPLFRGSVPGASVKRVALVDLTPEGRDLVRARWWFRVRAAGAVPVFVFAGISVGIVAWALGEFAAQQLGLAPTGGFWFTGAGRKDTGLLDTWPLALIVLMITSLVLMVGWRTLRRIPSAVVTNDYEEAFSWGPAEVYDDGSGRSFSVGDQISHKDFGLGRITNITGVDDKLVLNVTFRDGKRRLLAKVAPITLVAQAPELTE